MPQPSLYLETTIPSYLTARPSRDVLVLARQELTREWWERERDTYRVVVSTVVVEEIGRGDPAAAERRLQLVAEAEVLDTGPEVEDLAPKIREELSIPEEAKLDAFHLAFTMWHELDYLLTWNCRHIANAKRLRLLARFAAREGLWLPVICTPETMVPL